MNSNTARAASALRVVAAFVCAHTLLAQAQDTSPALRDSAGVVAADQLVEAAAIYCDREAPAEGTRLRRELAQWRAQHGVAAVRERLIALKPDLAQASPQAQQRMAERMGREASPAKACVQMIDALHSPQMDLRQRMPAAYDGAALVAPRAGSNPPAAMPAKASPPSAAAPAGAVVINPAQLAAMLERGRGVKGVDRALAAAGLSGPLLIRGRVVKRGEFHHLDHIEGPFHARILVAPRLNLSAFEGQEVTITGSLDGWPGALAFIRHARLVANAPGLPVSREPTAPGMVRMPVETDRVRTAPGRGVPAGDIVGVLYHGRSGVTGSGNLGFVEDATVLLRDGWACNRQDLPPSDLDAKASRELEPQRWLRWRRSGGGFEVQAQDDHGRPAGAWRRAEGTLKSPWPAGTRLNGSYSTASFHGSLALGGTYFKSTRIFHDDGRYTDSRYSQSGSGSVAATLNGFSAGGSSHSDARGTRSSAGGGGDGVAVATSSRRDDGAEHRGRYSLDGYTLEIHLDSGRVLRQLSFPLEGRNGLWIGSASYQPDRK